MRTVAIAELKARLSAELRRVREGDPVTVLDRRTPVAVIMPVPVGVRVVRPATGEYQCRRLDPLITSNPLDHLSAEREESW